MITLKTTLKSILGMSAFILAINAPVQGNCPTVSPEEYNVYQKKGTADFMDEHGKHWIFHVTKPLQSYLLSSSNGDASSANSTVGVMSSSAVACHYIVSANWEVGDGRNKRHPILGEFTLTPHK